ncbi:hypothetical protein H4R33_002846 [Dimargaris cristalligena]|uniref:Uncharacterized protein n=1 Tax=Dimargaris cristalligena TaxID=215637 RepID=A0A4P9ZUF1_9FUNG|nr:hypothetical protein H4R33_002846 [Dimargaris cristalligena]RKP37184.1 hypothetical protein BJ085DRAFT_37678 [Dimargaris cristalligena]|eukprot:RKP37184.1 hypothetical protein BJ085DRAFT_37678 [Dimargaris cristalligena]
MLQTPTKTTGAAPTDPLSSTTPLTRPVLPTSTGTPFRSTTPARRLTVTPGRGSPFRAGPPPGTFNSPIATPFIQRLNGLELQWRLRDAYRLLRKKDENIVLAAEIGQNLLRSNEEIKASYEKVLKDHGALLQEFDEVTQREVDVRRLLGTSNPDPPTPKHISPTGSQRAGRERIGLLQDLISDLERSNASLQERLEDAETKLKDKTRSHHRERTDLQQQLRTAASEVDRLTNLNANLDDSKQRLIREKTELAKSLKQLSQQGADVQSLQTRTDELQQGLSTALATKADLTRHISEQHRTLAELEQRCLEYQEQLADAQQEQSRYLDELRDAEETRRAYAEAQETIHALTTQVEELQNRESTTNASSGETPGNPTADTQSLLGEMEDKCRSLQTKHELLTQRHTGLVKAHFLAVHQKKRMKHHLDRLTTMAAEQPAHEAQLKQLEQLLNHTREENQELQRKVEWLENLRAEERAQRLTWVDQAAQTGESMLNDMRSPCGSPLRFEKLADKAVQVSISQPDDNCNDDLSTSMMVFPVIGFGRVASPLEVDGSVQSLAAIERANATIEHLENLVERLISENDDLQTRLDSAPTPPGSKGAEVANQKDEEIRGLRTRLQQLQSECDEAGEKLQLALARKSLSPPPMDPGLSPPMMNDRLPVLKPPLSRSPVISPPSSGSFAPTMATVQMAKLKAQLATTRPRLATRRDKRRVFSGHRAEILPMRPLRAAYRDVEIPLASSTGSQSSSPANSPRPRLRLGSGTRDRPHTKFVSPPPPPRPTDPSYSSLSMTMSMDMSMASPPPPPTVLPPAPPSPPSIPRSSVGRKPYRSFQHRPPAPSHRVGLGVHSTPTHSKSIKGPPTLQLTTAHAGGDSTGPAAGLLAPPNNNTSPGDQGKSPATVNTTISPRTNTAGSGTSSPLIGLGTTRIPRRTSGGSFTENAAGGRKPPMAYLSRRVSHDPTIRRSTASADFPITTLKSSTREHSKNTSRRSYRQPSPVNANECNQQ